MPDVKPRSNADSIHHSIRMVACLLALAAATGAVHAQDLPPATVESQGAATVTVAPSTAIFSLDYAASGDTLGAATSAAIQFEQKLAAALEAAGIAPLELKVSHVSIPDIAELQALIQAEIVYDTREFRDREEGALRFAALGDKLRTIAKDLGARISGPKYEVVERETIEENAIAQAMENAYANGEAAARRMTAQILGVEHVIIQRVIWNEEERPKASVQLATCTARVRVVYSVTTGPS